jgi:hypothetical protein
MRRTIIPAKVIPRRVWPSFALGSFGILFASIGFFAANAWAQTVGSSGSFRAVGLMTSARYFHTATALGNGKVLIAGGVGPVTGGFGTTNNAELFDPATGTFTSTSGMTSPRDSHTATLLPNGKVLIAGGVLRTVNGNITFLNTAELFDPATGSFTSIAPMNARRQLHTATVLPNGKALILGGDFGDQNATNNTAELFDPTTGTFTLLANTMTAPRSSHTTTLLPNGKLLLAGGYHLEGPFAIGNNSAESFDPTSESFSALAPMTSVRYEHTATLLANGKVLIAGGTTGGSTPGTNVSNTAESFDPVAGTFTLVSPSVMSAPRTTHTATLLPNGKVLLTGGYNGGVAGPIPGSPAWNNSADVFDPASGMFVSLLPNTMTSGRSLHTAVVLVDGRVLIAGGFSGAVVLNTAELVDFSTGSFASLPSMSKGRAYHTATALSNGKILMAGGESNTELTVAMAELFDPGLGSFTPATNAMTTPRDSHTATLLANGKVLMAGGLAGADLFAFAPTDHAELFDPDSGTFTAISSMTSARVEHGATLLPNGKVLLTGGWKTSTYQKTAELFDPATGTFKLLSHTLATERRGHTSTLLANGKVLIAGGEVGAASLVSDTAEIFDPITETFTPLTSVMSVKRSYHTATLLPNGKVLLTGGYDGSGYSDAADLFDPVSNTFTALPTMNSRRYAHTATLLANGKVLLAGGISNVGVPEAPTAELFDPVFGTFTSLLPNTMTSGRINHTATLLPSGQVLIAGGVVPVTAITNTTERFDAGLGFSDSRRPAIQSSTDPVVMPASLILSGSGFRGNSEANGGSPQSSATNYPIVQLMRIDNDQVFFPLSDPATYWSNTAFSSETLGASTTPLPVGRYRVTVFTNGIPSMQNVIEINGTAVPLVRLTNVVSRKAHGDIALFDIDLPLTGPPGIECRSGGASGNFTMIFTFATTLTSVDDAQVSSGIGVANGGWIGSDPHQFIVNLTGVGNAQVVTVNLINVRDSVGNYSPFASASMGLLLGDVNGNSVVSNTDAGLVKAQVGSPVTAINFRADVNVNHVISNTDVSSTKAQVGSSLP